VASHRATGITAYILLTLSSCGMALSSRIVKDWSPAYSRCCCIPRFPGWACVWDRHGLMLMTDHYFRIISQTFWFRLPALSPLAVGLGTLTFWIALVVSLSFAVRNIWTPHLENAPSEQLCAFVMSTAHGLLAAPMRIGRVPFVDVHQSSDGHGLLAYRVITAKKSAVQRNKGPLNHALRGVRRRILCA